jgi:hypothetical protein
MQLTSAFVLRSAFAARAQLVCQAVLGRCGRAGHQPSMTGQAPVVSDDASLAGPAAGAARARCLGPPGPRPVNHQGWQSASRPPEPLALNALRHPPGLSNGT